MSQITIKSPKHCASKQGHHIEGNYKKFFFIISSCFSILLLLILLIWLILRPSKPQFSLKDLDIYQLNLSGPYLNSSIHLSLLSKNPNQKVGIYYEDFQVYATYKSQQITMDSSLPPFYQTQQESNLLSASLLGNGIPVSPSLGYEVARDRSAGRLVLNVKINGKLRWKVGTWVSGRSRFNVNCVSFVAFGPSVPSGPLSSNQGAQCSADV
ncbi:NDR1/HIN1-like protein 26 [Prosopis cineraria]|uniref:NDR1/HIN1-like protein 26 n=1 Tax=Prosopis cineraria TaxID=364024 RepID=UPI00240FD752|nr:NDR1/HIN1-like protein 26 [Prosopis cineraria]